MKRKIRYLGIAESFMKKGTIVAKKSLLAGVVMRGDLQIDGFGFSFVTINGLDATKSVISLYTKLNRPDIRIILLGGVIISLYNVIDLWAVYESTHTPIIAVTYRESKGIEDILLSKTDGKKRLEIYRRNGRRIPVVLHNGYTVFIRPIGINVEDAYRILNQLTIHGRYPEPIRVAKLLAKNVLALINERREDIFELLP